MAVKKIKKKPVGKYGPRIKIEKETVREKQVAEIVDLMITLRWNASESLRLQHKYKISKEHIKQISQEAIRYCRKFLVSTPDELRCDLQQKLNFCILGASRSSQWGAAVQGIKTISDLFGIDAPTKVEVVSTVSKLTDEELEARKAELVAKLSKPPATDEEE